MKCEYIGFAGSILFPPCKPADISHAANVAQALSVFLQSGSEVSTT